MALKIKYWQQGKREKILFLWAYFEYFSHSSVPRFSKMSEGGVVGTYVRNRGFVRFGVFEQRAQQNGHTHIRKHMGTEKRGSKTGVTILTITTSS